MDSSDAHLERALEEYNQKVNELEPQGPTEQLLEAYINRGCILSMMEYRTSAMEDLDSASELIEYLETDGDEVDAGTYVKTYAEMGNLLFEQGADPVEAYVRAGLRVSKLNDRSRHFDHRSIVRMCIGVTEDLIDSEYPEDTEPFLGKGMSMVMTKRDAWSMNRYLELLNLEAEVADAKNDPQSAIESYARAIDVGTELLGMEQLEDPEELVMSFVSKAEAEDGLGLTDMYLSDANAAIVLMEQMLEFNRLDDTEVLISLHHDMAGVLMKNGRIEEAEKHLMKAMSLGVHGASEYMNSQTNRSF
ncbi:MAG: hypothetical protein ACI38Y_04110 [Candidatus Methanomethylophilaceae archaeon]